jgi:hypothetical protein
MKTTQRLLFLFALSFTLLFASTTPLRAASAQLLGWNNLGMHCMDSDYSVFSILPPYNTIEAQLIVGGKLITDSSGYTLTYQAIADPSGSFNSTAMGKGNFYTYSGALYGATPASERGLAGWAMPGLGNTPQTMLFEQMNQPAAGVTTPVNWWRAEGIPISPYDDALHKNPYPLMRIIARNNGMPIATNDVVLPVSDEMDCRACHASGSYADAKPAAGWVGDSNAERDYRLNILRLHDERQFAQHTSLYTNALAARGFNSQGLYQGVVADGKPVLCAACHASEALGAPSYSTIPPLTQSVHAQHASVQDPTLGLTLNNSFNRAACYRCHPGSTTKCLRGAMGAAVAADGSMAIQCQSCHGTMSQVGATNRVGWFMEPNCQSCHTGPATSNNGQIRYTSVFEPGGAVRVAVDQTFATQPNTPATGLSLYRFSSGHGGLQCEACHGSTHAEFPSTHTNDNIRNTQIQGHVGVMGECTVCHTTIPSTVAGGPHGMHPVGQDWVNRHPGLLEGGVSATQCRACHGLDYRGTVLSRAQGDRQLTASIENKSVTFPLFRGAIVGCYNCHNGPSNDSPHSSSAPTVGNIVTNTAVDQPVAMTLPATGANLALRIISQPAHGSVGLNNLVANYYPDSGFTGVDSFTFAAYDGAKNSGLGTGLIAVGTVIDTMAPGIRITLPTSNPNYSTTNALLTISGTATDNVAVVSVTWGNDRGGSGTATGTTSWTASGILLQNGVNVITVTARDVGNNAATDNLAVTYSAYSSLVMIINGNGTITPNLNGQNLQAGKSYSMTAKPATGYVFANWTGSVSANTPTLTFVLQPGMVLQANFVPNPFARINGTYTGLFYETDSVHHASSGLFTLTMTTGGTFSGKVLSGGSRYALSGQFDASGKAHVNVARHNMYPLSVDLQLDLTQGTDHLTGTVSDDRTWSATLGADRTVYDGKTTLAPQQGKYTLILPGSGDSALEPFGIGYGTVSVDKAGRLRLNGLLSDGTKMSQQVTISKSGQWPFYIPLYQGQGSIVGWLTLEEELGEDLHGVLDWFKPGLPTSKYYPAGFSLMTMASGSRYTQPPTGTRVLNFTDGKLVLDGGNLSQSITNPVTLGSNNKVTSSTKLSLSIALSTGSFKGNAPNPGGKQVSFGGVLLQNQNVGYGNFLGTNQSGRVYFGP